MLLERKPQTEFVLRLVILKFKTWFLNLQDIRVDVFRTW
jgi:hypothetical protein